MKHHLRHIPQKNRSTGCGTACVAMVTGKSYRKAIDLLDDTKRTTWSDLKTALLLVGMATAPRAIRVSRWDKITGVAIAKCSVRMNGNWHWVVVDGKNGLVLDPMNNGPRPFARVRRKVVSYLAVLD